MLRESSSYGCMDRRVLPCTAGKSRMGLRLSMLRSKHEEIRVLASLGVIRCNARKLYYMKGSLHLDGSSSPSYLCSLALPSRVNLLVVSVTSPRGKRSRWRGFQRSVCRCGILFVCANANMSRQRIPTSWLL